MASRNDRRRGDGKSSRTGGYSSQSTSGRRPVASTARSRAARVSTVTVGELTREERRQRSQNAYRSHMRRIFVILGLIAVLVVGYIVLYFSDAFAITEVTVSGVEHLTDTEMSELAAVPSDTTLLRVDTDQIKKNVMRDAWVEDVDVQRVFPHTLNLAVTERQIAATVEVSTDQGTSTELWAIADDGMWLCKIPDQDSEEGQQISQKIYEDAANVFTITEVAYGVTPEVGTYCTDDSILNALDIVTGMTTELKDHVVKVSASSAESTTLTLDNNVEIAFGSADDIRDKERVCLEIMEEHPDEVAYINVRVVSSPTWRAIS